MLKCVLSVGNGKKNEKHREKWNVLKCQSFIHFKEK